MKNYLLILPFCGLLLASCSEEQPREQVEIVKKEFTEKDIYVFETASAFAAGVPDSVREDSRKVFLNGIDLYRNKKTPDKAISEFKKAILQCPDPKSYYELGNALMDIRNYAEAIESYHMAEKMDYNPISKVLYNLACAYSVSENGEEALRYVQLAIENGYANSKHLLSDADLAFVRKMPEFSGVYEEAMSGVSSPEAALFDLYAMSFPQSSFPVLVRAEESQGVKLMNSIAYDFEAFVPEMVNPNFSREVGDEFYYLAKIAETDQYTAVIYAGVQVMYEKPPVYHILATYNKEGKVLDKLELGGYHYYNDPMRGYSIQEDLSIEVNEYQVVFEKDVEEFGYEDNPISANELLNTRKFKIKENGDIFQTAGDPVAWWGK